MSAIKVMDMAYGKLRSPDLDAQEEFLTHFGMVRADRTKNALYMRGTDPATTTDEQGRYSLAAPAAARDGVVVFTLTGYRGIGEAIRGEVWARRGAHDRVDLRHSAHQGGDRVPQDAGRLWP